LRINHIRHIRTQKISLYHREHRFIKVEAEVEVEVEAEAEVEVEIEVEVEVEVKKEIFILSNLRTSFPFADIHSCTAPAHKENKKPPLKSQLFHSI